MRFVIQRVKESEVRVDGEVLGSIGKGFMVLIGVSNSDTKEIADKMIKKMLGLRIFEDEQGKTNLSLDTVGGSLLLISQFTLYANCKKGNRPSFIEAGAPGMAEEMYEYIIEKCKEQVDQRLNQCMTIHDGPPAIPADVAYSDAPALRGFRRHK